MPFACGGIVRRSDDLCAFMPLIGSAADVCALVLFPGGSTVASVLVSRIADDAFVNTLVPPPTGGGLVECVLDDGACSRLCGRPCVRCFVE
jgi:hypothetical protein